MFFFSLIKIIALFLFIYFVLSLFKIVFRLNKTIKNAKSADNSGNKAKKGNSKDVIELDKDQYKVE